MQRQQRDLVKKLRAQGFETRLTSKQHLLVLLHGRRVACFAGTPSDHRAWKNSMAPLRRLGFTA